MEALGGDPIAQCRYFKFDLGGAFIIDRVRFFGTPRRGRHLFPAVLSIGDQRRGCAQRRRAGDQADLARQGPSSIGMSLSSTWRTRTRSSTFNCLLSPCKSSCSSLLRANGKSPSSRFFGTGSAPFASYISSIIDLGGPARAGRIDLVRQPITDRAHRPNGPRWRHVRSQYVLAFLPSEGMKGLVLLPMANPSVAPPTLGWKEERRRA